MEKCSERIVDYMLNNNIILEQDREIYLFGLISMLRIFLNIITLISLKITSIWQGTNFVDMYSKMKLLKNGWNSERLWR